MADGWTASFAPASERTDPRSPETMGSYKRSDLRFDDALSDPFTIPKNIGHELGGDLLILDAGAAHSVE
jgi:hypothetical protein